MSKEPALPEERIIRLLQGHGGLVRRVCFYHLGNWDDADDACQEAMLKAFKFLNRGGQVEEGKEGNWLVTIAVNHCNRVGPRRRSWGQVNESLVQSDDADDPSIILEREETVQKVLSVLTLLDPDNRESLLLRYWEQVSGEEAAEAMGVTPEAFRSRLYRARKQFAQLFVDETSE